MLRAPGRLLGVVGGGGGSSSGGGGEDEDALGARGSFSARGAGVAARGASLADMWIDFLQAQIAEGCACACLLSFGFAQARTLTLRVLSCAVGRDEGGADGASFGAAAAAMARGEGPNGVSFMGSPHAAHGTPPATPFGGGFSSGAASAAAAADGSPLQLYAAAATPAAAPRPIGDAMAAAAANTPPAAAPARGVEEPQALGALVGAGPPIV
jgi:hypothetical protein